MKTAENQEKHLKQKNVPVAVRKSFPQVFRILLLIIIPLAVYLKVVYFGYTGIDDSQFIGGAKDYNQHLSNISASFHRGLFQPEDKSYYDYYRPVFLVDLILEYQLFGSQAGGYHVMNLIFHILSVLLLYIFLKQLKLSDTNALLLALIFAVHPVLSQAVAWIPGRNDLLLMIFLISGLIFTIRFTNSRKWFDFLMQFIFFLLALFTKETGMIIPVLTLILLRLVSKIKWKPLFPLIITWAAGIIIWYLLKSGINTSGNKLPVNEMMESGFGRLPAILFYLGKIIFPVNLGVYPPSKDTPVILGLIALVLLTGLIIISGTYGKPLTIFGLIWFLLFLFPVLVVPKLFNDQLYEHRVYVPTAGILILISQTIFFQKKSKEIYRVVMTGAVICVFAVITFIRADYFKDQLSFWDRAAKESPHSAYAKMMMATWVKDTTEQERIFREAYALDSTEKTLNLYLGKIAFRKKEYDQAEQYLERELVHTQSSDIYWGLAQISFIKNNLDKAAIYLEKLIEIDPLHPQANHNLVLLYFQLNQKEKAKKILEGMKSKGMEISPELQNLVKQ